MSESTQVVKRLYEAFNSGDAEGFLTGFAEDATWNSPEIENVPVASTVKGRDGIAAFFGAIDEYEEFLKIEPTEYITEGDRVVVLGDLVVRSKLTDKQYDSQFVHIFLVEGENISSFLEFFDNAAAGRAHTATKAA